MNTIFVYSKCNCIILKNKKGQGHPVTNAGLCACFRDQQQNSLSYTSSYPLAHPLGEPFYREVLLYPVVAHTIQDIITAARNDKILCCQGELITQ